MAMPHYVYLLPKMPGKIGVLTFHGELKRPYDCHQEAIEYASTTRVPHTPTEVFVAVQQLPQSKMAIPTKKPSQSSMKLMSDPRTRDCAHGVLLLGYGIGYGPRPTSVLTTRSAVGLLVQ
jgi:hypothetical protein